MRSFKIIFLCALLFAPSPAFSADPSDLFSTILGEFGRQVERQQRMKQLKRLQPLWDACGRGDVAACDEAARFPGLNAQGRDDIARMRETAEKRRMYERHFNDCQKLDFAACQAALVDPHTSEADRQNLRRWQRQARQRRDDLDEFRQNENDCKAGTLAACDAAIAARHLDEAAAGYLEQVRAWFRERKHEREVAEREQAARAALDREKRDCFDGVINACTAAIANALTNAPDRHNLERQLARLQAAERDRQAREREWQAALAALDRDKRNCFRGSIDACTAAMANNEIDARSRRTLQDRRIGLAGR